MLPFRCGARRCAGRFPGGRPVPLDRRRPLAARTSCSPGSPKPRSIRGTEPSRRTPATSQPPRAGTGRTDAARADFLVLRRREPGRPWCGFILLGAGWPCLVAVLVPSWQGSPVGPGPRRRAGSTTSSGTPCQISGGLRAGHSMLRAIDAVAQEAESPPRRSSAASSTKPGWAATCRNP